MVCLFHYLYGGFIGLKFYVNLEHFCATPQVTNLAGDKLITILFDYNYKAIRDNSDLD